MNRTINPQELKSLLANKEVKVIDVRRKDDYAADNSAIPGASWFDPANIDRWCDTMPTDKELILYCVRGGAVSNSVVHCLSLADCTLHRQGGRVSLRTLKQGARYRERNKGDTL